MKELRQSETDVLPQSYTTNLLTYLLIKYIVCEWFLLAAVLSQSVSYAGENRRYVYTNLPKPVGLSVFGSALYWTDANLRKVSQLNSCFVVEIAVLFEHL